MENSQSQVSLKKLAVQISPPAWLMIIFLALSITWILLSDKLAFILAAGDNDFLRKIQQQKGLFFVVATGFLIYFISNRFYTSLRNSSIKYKGLEANYRALNEATREGIFDCDLETMTASMNSKMEFFIPSHKSILPDFWETFKTRIAPGNVNRLLIEFNQVIRSTRTAWQTEFDLLGSDNRYYTVLCSVHIIRNKTTNNATRLIGAMQDVSDLRNLQTEYFKEQISHRQTLATSIIEAQENEKNRWAEELHDNVCQLLSVAKMNLSAIPSMPHSAEKLTADAKDLVMKSIEEIRELSASIKPPALNHYLLIESIDMLLANITRTRKIQFNLDNQQLDETLLTDAHRVLIYRVIQEQLGNIVNYANATKVDIILIGSGEKYKITIQDNGDGFNLNDVKAGIGLTNIRSRLQVYKGKLTITSTPGHGCMLEARFYVNKTAATN